MRRGGVGEKRCMFCFAWREARVLLLLLAWREGDCQRQKGFFRSLAAFFSHRGLGVRGAARHALDGCGQGHVQGYLAHKETPLS